MPDDSSANCPPHRAVTILQRYLTLFISLQGYRAAVALGCMVLTSVLSGVGVLTLLPLLQLAGVEDDGTGALSTIRAFVARSGLAGSLGTVVAAFLVIYAVHSLVLRWLNLLTADVERSFTKTLEKRLHAAIMQCDWMFFLKNRNSDLTFALTNNVQRVAIGTISLLRLISTSAMTLVHVTLCLLISPLISVGLLGCFAVFSVVLLRYNRSEVESLKQRRNLQLPPVALGWLDRFDAVFATAAEPEVIIMLIHQ